MDSSGSLAPGGASRRAACGTPETIRPAAGAMNADIGRRRHGQAGRVVLRREAMRAMCGAAPSRATVKIHASGPSFAARRRGRCRSALRVADVRVDAATASSSARRYSAALLVDARDVRDRPVMHAAPPPVEEQPAAVGGPARPTDFGAAPEKLMPARLGLLDVRGLEPDVVRLILVRGTRSTFPFGDQHNVISDDDA